MIGNRDDVVARHHQRLAGTIAVFAAFLEHLGELGPRLRGRMLAAKFALAMSPAAVGNDGGDARVGAAGIDADRTAEARADYADAVRIDRRMLGQKFQRIAGILDLFEADD